MADFIRKHWFLPETPDVLGLLHAQITVTIEGVDAFAAWASGDVAAGGDVQRAEDRGDAAKRELLEALRDAFITPLEPEDLFTLSRGIDWILNGPGDLVRQAEVLRATPDQGIAEMAKLLAKAVRLLDGAVTELDSSVERATANADQAIAIARQLQRSYYRGMAATLEIEIRGERIALRELYRRCAQIGEIVIDVAERVVYSVVKES